MKTSRIQNFSSTSIDERIDYVANFSELTDKEKEHLYNSFSIIKKEYGEKLIENCICGNPLTGIITNANINDRDYLIPLSTEEPSIIAAASRAFKLAGENTIEAESLGNYMTGQIQITGLKDIHEAESVLKDNEEKILGLVNKRHRYTKAESIELEQSEDELLLYLIVNTGDIQGANTINKMCEYIAPYIEEITDGEVIAKIISNYADRCLVKGKMRIRKENLHRSSFSDKEVLERFLKVSGLAQRNMHRAATNNKGIMNGIIGVATATGQDTRAIEVAAHTYCCRKGKYAPLSYWYEEDEYLVGEIEMPMPIGIVRGATEHPYYSLGLKILGVGSAQEFQKILVSTGLANNFSATQEIATKGITAGHMNLHKKRFE
ncbi:MAG: hydroxymethylglutaryl-CoA reductase, degradative [archaeon]|nr:hydroxymethylglutaryl-CoA reductase, degradative [archaeon]